MKATEKEKEYFKKYAEKHRAEIKEYKRLYYLANRERARKLQKERYNLVKNNEDWKLKERERQKQWWESNKELHRAVVRAKWHKTREEVISHYSNGKNCCQRCGFNDMRALSIDHINGGGGKHRKRIKNFYSWLKRNNYPKGYQVLCMNCQFVKRVENQEVPRGNSN